MGILRENLNLLVVGHEQVVVVILRVGPSGTAVLDQTGFRKIHVESELKSNIMK
jgi:hypothetical protein